VLYLAPALEGTLQLITQNSVKVEIAVKSEPQISKLTTHELDKPRFKLDELKLPPRRSSERENENSSQAAANSFRGILSLYNLSYTHTPHVVADLAG
jgi:hypothetical protein